MKGLGAAFCLSDQLVGASSALLPWFEDERVTDILINGVRSLYVESDGKLCSHPTPFQEGRALFDLIERLVVPLGKRIDASHPYLDGKLADGSRFHIMLPPIAAEGPLISIRKRRGPDRAPLESFGPPPVLEQVVAGVEEGANLLICGGTGSGKTTLLSRLLDRVQPCQRIAILEECPEIWTQHPHTLRLETRSASPEGTGEVTLRALVRNALRMRPNRIVVGECRGEEAFELIQAMNTGHPGSLCTLHANGPLDGLRRLESLCLLSGLGLRGPAVREWIASAVDTVVYLEARQIRELVQVQGLEGEVYRVLPRWGPGGPKSPLRSAY